MKLAAALALPALLIALPADARIRTYHAVGTEPFWSLDIGPGSIVYTPAGGRRIITATPLARPTFNGRRYVTARIKIDITRTQCSDGMSERSYPDTVRISVGNRTITGCGGDPVTDADPLSDSRWTIVSIDGRPIGNSTPRPTEINFADGRITGNAGCNGFGGSYTVRGGTLIASRIGSTRMASRGPAMWVEHRFLSIIAAPATIGMTGRNRLTLTSTNGTAVLGSGE